MTLSLTFSQSFFERNVSIQLKLLQFLSIFFISKYSQKCGTFSQKCGNAGNIPTMRDFMHDCGTVDIYPNPERSPRQLHDRSTVSCVRHGFCRAASTLDHRQHFNGCRRKNIVTVVEIKCQCTRLVYGEQTLAGLYALMNACACSRNAMIHYGSGV